MPDVATDIQFDSYDFQDDTIITSDVIGDDSAPRKSIGVYELPVLHGAKKTFEKYQARHITLQGVLKSPTASGLIGKMEELKEVVTRQDKVLTITYPSYTRIYTGVAVESFEVQRPSFAINIADYKVSFLAPEPWSVQTQTSVSGVYSIAGAITSLAVGISGMLDPQPLLYFNTLASGSRFSISNQTTGDTIDVATTFSGVGRSLLIDTYNYQVTVDGVPVPFKGTFPRFKPNVQNTLLVNTYGTAGSAVDQSFENPAIGTAKTGFGSRTYLFQSFIPTRTGITAIELYLSKSLTGDVPPAITVEIRTTSASLPTSTVVATTTIAAFSSTTPAWRRASFSSAVTVTPGTTYAIVIYTGSTASGVPYNANLAVSSQYASGNEGYSTTLGASWVGVSAWDLLFRVYSDLGTPLTGKLVAQYNPRRL